MINDFLIFRSPGLRENARARGLVPAEQVEIDPRALMSERKQTRRRPSRQSRDPNSRRERYAQSDRARLPELLQRFRQSFVPSFLPWSSPTAKCKEAARLGAHIMPGGV